MITIINYGSGNIRAIANIYEKLNVPYIIANHPDDVIGAKKIFLPGVGAFDETISKIDEIGFRSVLDKEVLENKVPLLGICVGMQILAETSEEGSLKGLGYIRGHVKKFDVTRLNTKPKLPHLGWNSIDINKKTPLFDNINPQKGFYFLHTYFFECSDDNDILSTTNYGYPFSSAINHNNLFGFQFHPEKSHSNGVNLLYNFAKL
jgi:glutamine amidotransferase